MQFQFDPHQDFQLRAIQSAAGLFDGQPPLPSSLNISGGAAVIPNRLLLDDAALLANLQSVQRANELAVDERLEVIGDQLSVISEQSSVTTDRSTLHAPRSTSFPNFSVEMETGTGKTYVYLRTALELSLRYGLRKYIVVVPSVAVREGVLKTLRITADHLHSLYPGIPYRYYFYDSANLSLVRQFALSDGVEFMVMTIDSFNKASNVIRQSTDHLQGETPIHLIQAVRPVLILDEPQNMESELRLSALANLHPLLALRYSATHRNPYNLVYRLTPFDAYRQGLVKRIEVAGLETTGERIPEFRLEDIHADKGRLTARLAVHGKGRKRLVTVHPGDALDAKTGNPADAAFVVDEINRGEGYLAFTNGTRLTLGETSSPNRRAVFEAQIRFTLQEHFRKQDRLQPLGIKILTLFFIDRVANYAPSDGLIRQIFRQAFLELRGEHPMWADSDPEAVQAAYFAQRRTQTGEIVLEDSLTGEAERDRQAYELIMRDKERLLSLDEPVSFIFSHSALREGWDNPNIFQICTLNQTFSEIKKRQEIGRGVRLAVNEQGERVRDEAVNVLTVVANESYEQYVSRLQAEIAADEGPAGLPPRPANARQRRVAHLRPGVLDSAEFAALWACVSQKALYTVTVDSNRLISAVVAALDRVDDRVEFRPVELVIAKGRLEAGDGRLTLARQAEPLPVDAHPEEITVPTNEALPNLLGAVSALLDRATPPLRVTRRTLMGIFNRSRHRQMALAHPHEFARLAARLLQDRLGDEYVSGIRYTPTGESYPADRLAAEFDHWAEQLMPASRSVYDAVIVASPSERDFVTSLERHPEVVLYLKLPSWLTIPTPLGDHTPGWAVALRGISKGAPLRCVVCDLRPSDDRGQQSEIERRKFHCIERHFRDAMGVEYRLVTGRGMAW